MSAMAWLAVVVAGLAVFGLAWCLDRPKPEPQPRTERTLREFLEASAGPLMTGTVTDGRAERPMLRFIRHKGGGDA